METRNSLKMQILLKEMLRIQKDLQEMRGKKYAKLFRKFVKLWAGYFDRQVDEYIAYVDNNPQMFITVQKDSASDFEDENVKQLADLYVLGMELQEIDVQEQLSIGLSFDIENKEAIEWARTRVGELISGVNETTKKEIQKIIESALLEQKSMKEIKDEIYRKFIQYSSYRANLIAVMETGNAFEQGKKVQFGKYADKFGITGYKRSKTQGDDRVRQTHKQNMDA